MPGDVVGDEAFVSLVTNNGYANGALVLGYSLRRVNTTRKLVLLVAREVLEPTREKLARVWDHLEIVDLLDSHDAVHLALLTRPELGITFTKIHCWNLTQYRKCVFLDADTLVVQNCDELFEREELSAVPDIGWPDCFNSGVFVFEPSRATYEAILQHATDHGSFDGGDQGLLNSYFSDWRSADISRHLSFLYNMNSNASYTYAPAYQQFGRDVKIVHFIGPIKPWHYTYDFAAGNVYLPSGGHGIIPHEGLYLQLWWDIFLTFVQPGMRQCCEDHCEDQPAPHCPPTQHFEAAPHAHTQHSEPTPYIPPPQHFEPAPYTPPPQQFERAPHPPPPQHFQAPSHPPQHHSVPTPYIPPPQHFGPAPHQPPEHFHHTPQPSAGQQFEPSPQVEAARSESVCHQDAPEFQDEASSHDIHAVCDGISSLVLPESHLETIAEEHLDPVQRDLAHRQAWENGQVDYMGRDKFFSIQERIEEFIGSPRAYWDTPMLLA